MKLTALCMALTLSACASIPTTPKVFIACRVADTATTIAAVHVGATEVNPLMAHLLAHGYAPFIAVEAAVTWFVVSQWKKMGDTEKKVINVVGCIPPVNNVAVIAR